MIVDFVEFCGGEGIFVDFGVVVCGDDEVGVGGNFGCDDQFWIGLDYNFDVGGFGGCGEVIVCIGDNNLDD